jgi:hypothetical protein
MQITIGLRVLQGVAKDSWQTLEQGPIKEGPVKEGPVKTVSADTPPAFQAHDLAD